MTGATLSSLQATWILFGVFFTLMFLRVPIAFALGLACLPILLIEPRLDSMQLVQETFNAYNSFILLAVPFFLLAASLPVLMRTTFVPPALGTERELRRFEVLARIGADVAVHRVRSPAAWGPSDTAAAILGAGA